MKRKKVVVKRRVIKKPATAKKISLRGLRSKKLAGLISENIGKLGGGKITIGELMLKAGFAASTARQQKLVMDPLRESGVLDPLVKVLDKKIQTCADAMTSKKIKKEGAYTNALTLDILVKNRRLITGKATGITEIISPGRLKELHAEVEERINEDGVVERRSRIRIREATRG